MGKRCHLLMVLGLLSALGTAVRAAEPFEQMAADGLVVIEAEAFHDNVSQGGHDWVLVTTPAGFSGTGAMQSLPDSGTNNDTGYVTNSPRLDYQVNFKKAGVHYVWVRGHAHLRDLDRRLRGRLLRLDGGQSEPAVCRAGDSPRRQTVDADGLRQHQFPVLQ
jgi:hypothetical protein